MGWQHLRGHQGYQTAHYTSGSETYALACHASGLGHSNALYCFSLAQVLNCAQGKRRQRQLQAFSALEFLPSPDTQ